MNRPLRVAHRVLAPLFVAVAGVLAYGCSSGNEGSSCSAPTACQSDSDCTLIGSYCENGTCSNTGSGCASGLTCFGGTCTHLGAIGEACTPGNDLQCASACCSGDTSTCIAQPPPCYSDSDCGNYVCNQNQSNYYCFCACTDDSYCGAGFHCVGSACR